MSNATTPARRTPHRGDGGAASIELVLLTPVLLALLLLVVAGGRLASARAKVDGAARDAARAATIARSPSGARAVANATVGERLQTGGVECRQLTVDLDTTQFRPGGEVKATVTCVVDLADLTLLGIPGTRSITTVAVETVDAYRGISSEP
jgi:Flp pilus assembly protein TadG